MDLATCPGPSGGFLLASVSDRYVGRCSVIAYSWQDLGLRKSPKVFWSVDQTSVAQMPVDVNQICVEGIEKKGWEKGKHIQDTSPRGCQHVGDGI